MDNPRLHPTLIPLKDWPTDTLFVIPTLDILLYEQLDLVERLGREIEMYNEKRPKLEQKRVEKLVFEGQWHGWLDCALSLILVLMPWGAKYANKLDPSAIMDYRRVHPPRSLCISMRLSDGCPSEVRLCLGNIRSQHCSANKRHASPSSSYKQWMEPNFHSLSAV